MAEAFIIKAVVENKDGPTQNFTAYLFNKEKKIILPLILSPDAGKSLMSALAEENEPRPEVHDTIKRIILSLGGVVECVVISGYHDEIFYSYVLLKKDGVSFDIDARPSDSLCVAARCKAPILIENDVLGLTGIEITKELLTENGMGD
jgi:hypothetical protein